MEAQPIDDEQMTQGPELDPPEAAKAIAAEVIASGGSYSEAAEEARRSKRTIVRWMADPAFARLVADMRFERVSELTGRLSEMTTLAVHVLSNALLDENAGVRLRAAHLTLEWSVRLHRVTDHDARLLEVERRQGIRPSTEVDETEASGGASS